MGDMTEEIVIRNLRDAGCNLDIIEKFLFYFKKDDRQSQLYLLQKHRNHLLDSVHQDERRIDCLDYLVYQIQKNVKGV